MIDFSDVPQRDFKYFIPKGLGLLVCGHLPFQENIRVMSLIYLLNRVYVCARDIIVVNRCTHICECHELYV